MNVFDGTQNFKCCMASFRSSCAIVNCASYITKTNVETPQVLSN